MDLALTWIGKQPTLDGEASSISFRPAPEASRFRPIRRMPIQRMHPGGFGRLDFYRRQQHFFQEHQGSPWRFDKLGSSIDPEGVVDGGGQFCHGVWGGAAFNSVSGVFRLESLDAATMSPMTPTFPEGQPFPFSTGDRSQAAKEPLKRLAPGSVSGVAVNLHNNLWSDGYPFIYPFYDPRFCSAPSNCSDANSRFRFRLHLGDRQDWR